MTFAGMVLTASNIHKSYGSLEILKGVNLEVHKGEIVSIVGKSGAGKSTLLHILGTLDSPDKGSISISGTDTNKMSARQLAAFRNQHIGFVFQFHHLLPEFTALENVCIPGLIGKKNESDVRKRAAELLDYLGLRDRLTHKPAELSGGEQQRVAVARALINNPSVIFADEPTGNLDSQSSGDLHNLLRQLRQEYNQTFVIVTHNKELAELSDRCLEMKDGLLV
ncbi:MAG: ABC transporter ATP-binding protein [Bacteroidota bacterium]|jgi:lipoprotein-releasing system ATP-binding protein|nr:ABC transporter ATP-binding protein [Saprospiraceae bacterium]